MSTSLPSPEPSVEKDRKATRGSQPRMAAALSADAMAMEASSSAVGSGLRPQSAKTSVSPSEPSKPGISTMAMMELTSTPSARPITLWVAISRSPVVATWPAKVQSTSPSDSSISAV